MRSVDFTDYSSENRPKPRYARMVEAIPLFTPYSELERLADLARERKTTYASRLSHKELQLKEAQARLAEKQRHAEDTFDAAKRRDPSLERGEIETDHEALFSVAKPEPTGWKHTLRDIWRSAGVFFKTAFKVLPAFRTFSMTFLGGILGNGFLSGVPGSIAFGAQVFAQTMIIQLPGMVSRARERAPLGNGGLTDRRIMRARVFYGACSIAEDKREIKRVDARIRDVQRRVVALEVFEYKCERLVVAAGKEEEREAGLERGMRVLDLGTAMEKEAKVPSSSRTVIPPRPPELPGHVGGSRSIAGNDSDTKGIGIGL